MNLRTQIGGGSKWRTTLLLLVVLGGMVLMIDRTIASWRTWGFLIAMAGLMLGVGAYAAANPPPDAIYSATQMFFLFEIPFLLVMTAIIILIGSLHGAVGHSPNPRRTAVRGGILLDCCSARSEVTVTVTSVTDTTVEIFEPGGGTAQFKLSFGFRGTAWPINRTGLIPAISINSLWSKFP